MSDKKKILLAEDDKFISLAYRDGFKKAGFEVLYASDGQEAINLAQNSQPDIILLDIIMPVKNGFEALEEIRKISSLKDVPILVLSNLGQETDIQKAKSLGADDYLIKSNYSLAEVVKFIEKHLK
jgi:DNA-binding response OmpR family regulator